MLDPKENREIWLKAANESRGKISGRVKTALKDTAKVCAVFALPTVTGIP